MPLKPDPRLVKPLAYIEGSVEFYGCTIKTTPAALIPRQESEILIDIILKRKLPAGSLLDLCTGTGCLGLAIKKARPDMEVTLSDISTEALDLARENAQLNGLKVELLEGDFLEPAIKRGLKFDYLICNPPYVTASEYEGLDPSVKDFEPKLALVGGEDGLLFYRRLSQELPAILNPGAQIFLEIGGTQGVALQEIFSAGSWANVQILPDWAGWDRFCFAKFLYK